MPEKTKPGYRDGNSTADRALTILQMFTADRPRISAVEVAEHLGASRSTAYRYLQTLVGASFLREDDQAGFRLGSKVMELAAIARRGFSATDRAIPVMRTLTSEYNETVLLTKRIGSAIVCLEREESSGRIVRLSYERGSQLSYNAGASALVLLAWLPEPEARALLETQPLPQYTASTLTTVDEIMHRLREIRAEGHVVAQGEVDPNVVAVAAPIFDHKERVDFALSVVMLRPVSDEHLQAVTEALTDAARSLSEENRVYTAS